MLYLSFLLFLYIFYGVAFISYWFISMCIESKSFFTQVRMLLKWLFYHLHGPPHGSVSKLALALSKKKTFCSFHYQNYFTTMHKNLTSSQHVFKVSNTTRKKAAKMIRELNSFNLRRGWSTYDHQLIKIWSSAGQDLIISWSRFDHQLIKIWSKDESTIHESRL